jgi:hypothetical protein
LKKYLKANCHLEQSERSPGTKNTHQPHRHSEQSEESVDESFTRLVIKTKTPSCHPEFISGSRMVDAKKCYFCKLDLV